MPKETKNQTAWKHIDESLHFIDAINRTGEFNITADQIKEHGRREPRLMAKFDHSINRPEIFINNEISILPISSSSYKLFEFNSFNRISYGPHNVILDSHRLLERYQTIDLNNIRSEDSAILISDITGIISNFTGDKNIRITTKGKFGVGNFSFTVDTTRGPKSINVNGTQAELDAGFEGEKIYLMEAKLGKVDDFNIRQLYYPFRFWKDRAKKEIVPIFLTYSDGVFSLWEYSFDNIEHFNSIKLIKHSNYAFDMDDKNTLLNALNIDSFITSDPSHIPFPQADDFEKVISILELVNSGVKTKEELADFFSFDIRQADYYYNACRYLGLVDSINGQIILTKLGNTATMSPRNKRHALLINAILSRKVFYDAYNIINKQHKIEDVIDIMKSNSVLEWSTDAMYRRRAQTIIAWCKWINKLIAASK